LSSAKAQQHPHDRHGAGGPAQLVHAHHRVEAAGLGAGGNARWAISTTLVEAATRRLTGAVRPSTLS